MGWGGPGGVVRRRSGLALSIVLVAAQAAWLGVTASSPAGAAAGLAETTVASGLNEPTDVAFSPDGRVFVAEKSGIIKEFDGLGGGTGVVVVDLRTEVHNYHDRGLMGIALSPQFPLDPSLFVSYAHDAAIGGTAPQWGAPGVTTDGCPNPPGGTQDGCVISGRVSRLDLGALVAPDQVPEQVLVEDWCQQFNSHSLGDVEFGPDGYLYVSAGEGANYNYADYGQDGLADASHPDPGNPCADPPGGTDLTPPSAQGGALRAQDLQTMQDPLGLDGSVIRIDPGTGLGATGNPLTGSADLNAQRVVAAGFRNPFRFTFRPGSSDLWVGDVGWNLWDEIDRIDNPIDDGVDNFAWPCKEGAGQTSSYASLGLTLCEHIYSGEVPTAPPYFSYRHGLPVLEGDGCPTNTGSALSGLAFYRGDSYPPAFHGALFFADYARQCIWSMPADAQGLPDPNGLQLIASNVFPVSIVTGPNDDLFYVDIAVGEVRRIYATGNNTPPSASVVAAPDEGALPLHVALDASGSSDVEPGALTFAWDLDGDGQYDDGAGPTATVDYVAAGQYFPSVRVTDTGGLSDTAAARVLAGTTPPTPTIDLVQPADGWTVGEPITFSGSATDPEDGSVPAGKLTWDVIVEHCATVSTCHEHHEFSFEGVASGSFDAPDHEYPAHLELRLTATDSAGVSTTTTQVLTPRLREVTVVTEPAGLEASVGSKTATTPFTTSVIDGSVVGVSTAQAQQIGNNDFSLVGWSDGGAGAHNVQVAGEDRTLTATFARSSTADASLVAAYDFDEGTGQTLVDHSGLGNNGTISGATWTTDRGGHVLAFDGSNDSVTVPDAVALHLSDGMTIEAWVRPSGSAVRRPVLVKQLGTGLSYGVYTADPNGRLHGTVFIGGADTRVVGGTLPSDTWTHLAVTYDGTMLRLYVNGALAAEVAKPGILDATTEALSIGAHTARNDWFLGRIDDVRIYSRALEQSEIDLDRVTQVSRDTNAPSSPKEVTASAGKGSVALSWGSAGDDVGVTRYDVHRSTSPAFTPADSNVAGRVSGETFTDHGLDPGTTYYYRVTAHDAAGNSSVGSAPVSGVPLPTTVPGPVRRLIITTRPTGRSWLVDWRPPADDGGLPPLSYRVVVRHGGKTVLSRMTTSSRKVLWRSRLPVGRLRVLVRARNDEGQGPSSGVLLRVR